VGRNPYIAVHRRQAAHRRRVEGALVVGGRIALGLAAVGLGAVLVRPVFLGFLDGGGGAVSLGVAGMVLRAGLVLVGIAAIDLYEAVIRGRDREVLSLLPVEPDQVVIAAVRDVVLRRAWLVPAVAVLLLPIGIEASWVAWAAAVAALAGIQLAGWSLSAVVHLLAVDVAESAAWAPLLDMIRGANPREQAAFLYAPGVVLTLAAALLYAASEGAAAAATGAPWGWALIAATPIVGAVIALALPSLARRAWFRATGVLADIDARWAALAERGDDRTSVYLDWTVRFLPAGWRRYALHDLRHGWRGRRTWISGAWVLGIAAAAAGWTEDPVGPSRALAVSALAAALVASAALVLERDEPPFLRWWLPVQAVPRWAARSVVVVLWAQPALLPAALVTAYLSGMASGGLVLLGGELLAAVLVGLSLACSRFLRTGPWLYGTAAAGLVAAAVLVVGGLG
jgi:hypothetical protein